MNLESFKNWALAQGQVGNPTSAAGQLFLGQCVSLVQQYINKVYGIPWQARGHAKDWPTNGNVLSYFDRVSSPQPGDIGVSGPTSTNPYGHIWIYLPNNQILEQNGRTALRVTVSPNRPAMAILRRKGTVVNQPPQGDIMITENDRDPIRVISSEVKGWDFDQVHKGTWDAREVNAWKGRPWKDFIMQGWAEGAGWRAVRQQKMRDYDVLAKQVSELSTRPTKAELDAVVTNLKLSQEKVSELEKQVQDNPDTQLINEGKSWLQKLIERFTK